MHCVSRRAAPPELQLPPCPGDTVPELDLFPLLVVGWQLCACAVPREWRRCALWAVAPVVGKLLLLRPQKRLFIDSSNTIYQYSRYYKRKNPTTFTDIIQDTYDHLMTSEQLAELRKMTFS